MRILVVDDDPDVLAVVTATLAAQKFDVDTATSGESAVRKFAEVDYDLVVLDVMMERRDAGHTTLRAIRRLDRDVPVIFLTARATEVDVVVGLELGADDYLVKPFRSRELVARVHAALRRSFPTSGEVREEAWVFGELQVDPGRLEIRGPGGTEELSRIEFLLVKVLVTHAGVPLSRERIAREVYGDADEVNDRTIDSHIRRLRAKIATVGEDPIETVRGVGYRIEAIPEADG